MLKNLRSYRQKDDGAAAIEFAIVSIPFFLLIMGIIEIGIMFGAATVLNGATEDAARMIRTGQAQQSASAEATFTNTLCGRDAAGNPTGMSLAFGRFIDCADLRYQVITLPDGDDFETARIDPDLLPTVIDNSDPTNPGQLRANSFDPGDQNDRVIIRVSYDYQLLTPMAAALLSTRPGNKWLMLSTAIIQNEPY